MTVWWSPTCWTRFWFDHGIVWNGFDGEWYRWYGDGYYLLLGQVWFDDGWYAEPASQIDHTCCWPRWDEHQRGWRWICGIVLCFFLTFFCVFVKLCTSIYERQMYQKCPTCWSADRSSLAAQGLFCKSQQKKTFSYLHVFYQIFWRDWLIHVSWLDPTN